MLTPDSHSMNSHFYLHVLTLLRPLILLCCFLFFSCQQYSQKSMNLTDYQSTLEDKYGQSFTLKKKVRTTGNGKRIVTAFPTQSPDQLFYAEFDRQGTYLSDTYSQSVWSQQLQVEVEQVITCGELKQVLKVVYYQLSEADFDPKHMPTVQEMIQLPDAENKADVWLHMFANADDEQELQDIVSCIHRCLTHLNAEGLSTVFFHVAVYDTSIAEENDLSTFSYGYTQIQSGSFEELYKDHLRKRIVFEWTSAQQIPEQGEIMAIIDHAPSYFGSKVNRFAH